MEKHPIASKFLEPTDATLKTVERAWLVVQEQRGLFDKFRNFVRDEEHSYDVKSSGAAVNVVKWQIEDFCEQLHHLEVALLPNEQNRPLRWIYHPHSVSCQGNIPEPLSRHDSYSQAVYKFAWQTLLSLPFIDSPEMRELNRRHRKPGSPLPKVAFDKVFLGFRDELDAAVGVLVETRGERACNDKSSGTSSPVPFESSCEIYAEVRERILATYFDTAELELLVRREYAAVADRLGAVQDTPIDPKKTRYSTWIDSRELVTVIKSNGLRKGNPSKSTLAQQITRIKKRWGAEPQPKTHNSVFRFRLDQLDKLGIKYPLSWEQPPSVETE